MRLVLFCLCAGLAVAELPTLQAQLPTMSDVDRGADARAAGPLPEWDVAVVKQHPPEDHVMSWRMTADGLSLVNLSLEQMICSAWDVKPYQVSGLSGWMTGAQYDVTAKVSPDDAVAYKKLNQVQRREMLQRLLGERFHLKAHLETKTLPVYDLMVDKGGSKLTVSTAIEAPSPEDAKDHPEKYKKGQMMMGPGIYEGTGQPLRSLASQLGNAVGRPVRDTTGLTGLYDIKLRYRPEEGTGGAENADAPSVFDALQALGLKLVATKGQVETLVVDAAQKPDAD